MNSFNFFSFILNLLKINNNFNNEIIIISLEIFNNILESNENNKNQLLNFGLLNYLKDFFNNNNKKIDFEIIFSIVVILNTISKGTEKQKLILIEEKFYEILEKIYYDFSNNISMKKKIIECLCNLISIENKNFIEFYVKNNNFILKIINENLNLNTNINILIIELEFLIKILKFGKENKINQIKLEIENLNIDNKIENLQNHFSKLIYEKCFFILTNFFDVEDSY